jgi:hypothetical protein
MPMVKFTPSPEQREIVAALSAAKMPLEKIAASIVNPRTQRAISVKTLGRMFKDQLDAGVGTIVKAYQGLVTALENREAWAIKYTLDNIAGFTAKAKDLPEAVKQGLLEIRVTGVEPLPVQDPAPAGEIIDLLANKDPLKRIPSRDAIPAPWADEPAPQPEPPPMPYNQGGTLLKGNSPYATELDDPEYWKRKGGWN